VLAPGTVGTKLIDAAAATGVAASQRFGIHAAPSGQPRTVEYQATSVPATALSAQLEESQDGGTSFNARGAAIDMFTNRAGVFTVNPGCIYRLNITVFTGAGTATVLAVVS
ncbi:MAG: hypothetical protein L0Z53_13475, partial [Acidobacteriales bacterium]|nr:hypothetical protein [Terriglobales bacterium]